jgi:hypothetical protein
MRKLARDCVVVLAGVLVVLVLFTTAKFFASSALAPSTSGIRGARRLKRIDYIFIGSSLTRQDYDIGAMERQTGKTMYALAYNGLNHEYMSKVVAYLCGLPDVSLGKVIIEASPLSILEANRLYDERLYFDAPYPLKVDILKLVARGSNGTDRWTSIWDLMVTSSNDAILSYPITRKFIDARSYHGGYTNMKYMPPMTREKFASIAEAGSETVGWAEHNPEEAILAVQQTLVQNRIAFAYVEPPISIARQHGPRFLAAKAALKALISPKGMTYVDFSENEFDSSNYEYFTDSLHMSTKGRTVFSGLIAERMSAGKL